MSALMLFTLYYTLNSCALEVTSNLGFASEYYYRGVYQSESSANAGLDFSHDQLSGGIWTADVGDGLEWDVFAHYQFNLSGDLAATVGFTHYDYTGEFDKTYKEINLGLKFHFISFEYAKGQWDGGDSLTDDYSFAAITLSYRNFYSQYGSFGDEFDGDYLELGFTNQTENFEYTVTLILSSDELSDQLDRNGSPTESEALLFSLSKSFDL
jgi:uncharacterized protein (TIGR02001 family)